jgi:hypothetical protein
MNHPCRCELAWSGRSTPQSSGPRQEILGPSLRRVGERQAVLTAPPYRGTGLCAVNVSLEPGLGREAAPGTSAPQRKHGVPPLPMPAGKLRRRGAHRAPKGRDGLPSLVASG